MILRVVYASILIAFLLLVSFYLDLLSDYDALSLVLGFVVCIILQFSFLSYYFRREMKKYKIDEIGVRTATLMQSSGKSSSSSENSTPNTSTARTKSSTTDTRPTNTTASSTKTTSRSTRMS